MKSVSVYDLRDNLANYLTMVSEKDMSIVVNRFRKPIAVLMPVTSYTVPSPDRFFGFLGKGERGDRVVSRLRRSPAEKRRANMYRNRSV